MYIPIFTACALLALGAFTASSLCAAEAAAPHKDKGGAWVYPTYTFAAKKGDWTQNRNWKDNKLPQGELPCAYVDAGSSMTISRPVDLTLSSLLVRSGVSNPTEVFFKDNAKLNVGRLTLPAMGGSGANFHMEGGELTVGNVKGHSYYLSVGTNATLSAVGQFAVSAGTLRADYGVRVGNSTQGTQQGVFLVQGSKPEIFANAGESSLAFFLGATGTLTFDLDDAGVSALDARKGDFRAEAGATICVNGKAYTGGPKVIVLVRAQAISMPEGVRTEVSGFRSSLKADISVEKNRVVLKIANAR